MTASRESAGSVFARLPVAEHALPVAHPAPLVPVEVSGLVGGMPSRERAARSSAALGDDLARVEQWRTGVQDWQLLLQLDTDPEAQMLWGIEGRCYYWIQSEALRARHFENVWFIMQWT